MKGRSLHLKKAQGSRLAGEVFEAGTSGTPVLLVHGGGQTTPGPGRRSGWRAAA
ncbi:hypothetical protein [Breoghania sp.]|uniref:hypothetical protein n=1 Tax=Breoghania sp. TaxID=2065378 RepID=UPI00260A6309|nr:hypothetical protein [Breoghania sp.]MDJ0931979.1 hypothetical protein [Breoghania sp.]